jgi:hypothetical protein
MADTYTPNLNLVKPEVGASTDTWGVKLNDNIDDLDALFPSGALALSAGGTGAGTAASARTNLDVPSTSGSGATGTWGIDISGNAATADSASYADTAGSATNATNATGTGTAVSTTATQTLTNKTVTNVVIDGNYTEEVFTITDGTVDLNPANGTIQLWTLGANRSPTASSFAAGQSMTLLVDDGSAYTITWPSVTWKTNGGVAPTLNTSGYTAIVLWKVGSTLFGARVGDA